MLLHYLVKCIRHSLAVYNNEFVLISACVGSIATNTSNSCYFSKHHAYYIISFLLGQKRSARGVKSTVSQRRKHITTVPL